MIMKKLLSLLLAMALMFSFTACSGKKTEEEESERKRATAGQDTTTSTTAPSDDIILDTGLLSPLDETYAKSNKADLVYDPNVFVKLANSNDGKINIACVGDSITYGTIADSPTKKDNADISETAYPTKLQQKLKSRYGDKFEVTNYGYAGAYIADFERTNASTLRYCNTAEYTKLRKDKPEIVIMMLGINDIGYINDGTSCAELQAAYSDLIADIKKIESNPIVFVCTPLVRTTAYSSYLALEPLCNAIIAAANEQKAYVIDTYNITKEYFETALYETDGLHPDAAGYDYLADVIFAAVTDGLTDYKAGTVEATPNYVVYVNSRTGTFDSVGATPDKPTSSLARAIDLCRGGGTIVVSGPINPAKTASNITRVFIAPKNTGKITITSVYGGVDYRTEGNGSAKITLSASTYLQGDIEFNNVNFEADASSLKFVCNYNNVTFGKGITNTVKTGGHSVLIFGHDVVSRWQTEDALSCKKDATLTVESGTFTYLRGGNYRAVSTEESPYAYGTVKSGVTVNIVINGGSFAREDGGSNYNTSGGTLSSALGQNGMEKGSAVNFTLNGGKIYGALFAVPRLNPYNSKGAPAIAGDINITVNGGSIGGAGIDYQQRFDGDKLPKVTGSYNLVINKDPFTASSKLSLSAAGCANSTVTLGAGCADIAVWTKDTISTFKTVNK